MPESCEEPKTLKELIDRIVERHGTSSATKLDAIAREHGLSASREIINGIRADRYTARRPQRKTAQGLAWLADVPYPVVARMMGFDVKSTARSFVEGLPAGCDILPQDKRQLVYSLLRVLIRYEEQLGGGVDERTGVEVITDEALEAMDPTEGDERRRESS